MVFIELPAFSKQGLFDDEALRAIQAQLLVNPDAGDVIPGGHGLRKLRASLGAQGKRGGARIIYYWWCSREICYLVYAYAKNRQENLTPVQVRLLSAAMKEVLSHE